MEPIDRNAERRQQRAEILSDLPWSENAPTKLLECGDGWLDLIEAIAELGAIRGVTFRRIWVRSGRLELQVKDGDAVTKRVLYALRAACDRVCESCGSDAREVALISDGMSLKTLCVYDAALWLARQRQIREGKTA